MVKGVRWAVGLPTINPIPGINEYSLDEKRQLWFTHDEHNRIRQECDKTIKSMRKGLPENHEVCYRGLESKELGIRHQRKRKLRMAKSVLLEEAGYRGEEGHVDPEAIRDISEALSLKSKQEAHKRGMSDAAYVVDMELMEDLMHVSRMTRSKRSQGDIFPVLNYQTILTSSITPVRDE